jgi:mercuric ion binding protein
MKGLLCAAVLTSGLLAIGPAQAAERTVILAVENMTCASCPYIVSKAIASVPGVEKVNVSHETGTAVVTFDDTKTTVQAIAQSSLDAGYPANPVEEAR